MLYIQSYSPLPYPALSVFVAALPVLVLFFLLVIRRAPASLAALGGALTAFIIAITLYRMPPVMAGLAFVNGALFGLFPICWTVATAMFLYNLTVETGRFEQIKNSIAGLSTDHRLQALLIAFSFGAFLEGAAGGGTPVAICAAMLVGLGFRPFLAACICLIANTSPVAYSGFGTPILTLQSVTGIDALLLSKMAGNQLPLMSCLIPLWLVRCLCSGKQTLAVLPAIAVSGGSFAIAQYFFAHSSAFPLTDIAGGLISLVSTAVFLRFWSPRSIWRMEAEAGASAVSTPGRMGLRATLQAWLPFLILCVLMAAVGSNKKACDRFELAGIRTSYEIPLPGLDKQVERRPPVVETPTREAAIFKFNWLTMPGTSILATILIMIPLLRVRKDSLGRIAGQTVGRWRSRCRPSSS